MLFAKKKNQLAKSRIKHFIPAYAITSPNVFHDNLFVHFLNHELMAIIFYSFVSKFKTDGELSCTTGKCDESN